MLCKFFHFYAHTFSWGHEVGSVRTGQRLDIRHSHYAQLHGHGIAQKLHIEDPFVLERNLSCTLQQPQERTLLRLIQEASAMLEQGMMLPGLTKVQQQYPSRQLFATPRRQYPTSVESISRLYPRMMSDNDAEATAPHYKLPWEPGPIGKLSDPDFSDGCRTIPSSSASQASSSYENDVTTDLRIPTPREVPVTWLSQKVAESGWKRLSF
jgi:hypothetical protein